MKKKVALLLVLSLLLAVLPMNVFGQARGRVVGILPAPATSPTAFIARVDIADIARHMDSISVGSPSSIDSFIMLRFTLTGGADGTAVDFRTMDGADILPVGRPAVVASNMGIQVVNSTHLTGASGFTPPAFDQFSVEIIHSTARQVIAVLRLHENNAWTDASTGVAINAAIFGTLDMEISGIRPRDAGGNLTVEGINRFEQPTVQLVNSPLTVAAASGVTINRDGAVRAFNSALLLPEIQVRERAPGALPTNGELVIRLLGPNDYVWNTGIGAQFSAPLNVQPSREGVWTGDTRPWTETAGTGVGTFNVLDSGLIDGTGRPYLDLRVNIPNRASDLTGQLLQGLNINGLMLVPTRHARLSGEIAIDVELGVNNGGTWANTGYNDGMWRNRGIAVGNRISTALEMTVDGDLPDLVSGLRNVPSSGDADQASVHRAARLDITELVPGAFDTGFLNSMIEYTFSDGVQLVHAAWRLTNGGNDLVTNWQWTARSDDAIASSALGVPFMTPDSLNLFIPRATNATALRSMQVFLYFSVEAGYEWKYDGEPVNVTVGGNAVAALEGSRSRDVANVVDPISMTIDGDPVQVQVTQAFTSQTFRIPDVVIQEAAVGSLRRGSSFVLSLEALPTAIFGTHAITSHAQPIIDTESGLRLTSVRSGNTIRFTVDRESTREAATITLTDLFVTGTFIPGIEYVVALNAIGANSTTPATGNQLTVNTWMGATNVFNPPGTIEFGRFDAIPYYALVATFGDYEEEHLPPTGGNEPGGPGLVERGALEVTADMASMTMPLSGQTVQTPYRLVQGVGMVAVRAIAEVLLGVEPGWDQATGTVTITAHHADTGAAITVILTVGNNVAIVNGFPVDIATHGDFRSGPAGSVRPLNVDGRIMLPARFLGEVFGYHVEAVTSNGTVVGVSIR
jgi:hypothetical protein